MTDLEKAEKLHEKTGVSFTEAKEALTAADGDLLDALIYLENKGRVTTPAGGGHFNDSGILIQYPEAQQSEYETGGCRHNTGSGESLKSMLKKLGRFLLVLLEKGNANYLDATKEGRPVFSCPVTIVVVLLLCFFWLMLPMFVISLFFGLRYSFRGNDLGKDSVNRVMDGASSTVNDIKKSFSKDSEKV